MSDHFIGQGCSKSFKVEFANKGNNQYTKVELTVFEDNGECIVSFTTDTDEPDEYAISFDELYEIKDGLLKFIEGIYR